MKLRCMLRLHGPLWANDDAGLSDYSRRIGSFLRWCPHCHSTWTGSVREYRGVRCFGPWTYVGKFSREVAEGL